ncbi:fatty acyl-AMP ligase [Endothiovibrio diazotrophicus]
MNRRPPSSLPKPGGGEAMPDRDFEQAAHVVAVLRGHASARGEQEALILVRNPDREDGADTWSYRELDTAARRIGGWLQQHLETGSRVLLLFPVGLDFAAAFWGCLYAGMIAVPAPLPGQYHHQRRRVKAIAASADIGAVFTDAANLSTVQDWAQAEGLSHVPAVAVDTFDFGSADAWRLPELAGDTLALLQYTSGSTGDPKGVMISHRNLQHNAASFRRALGFDAQTRFGGWIPLYHDMGLMAQLLPPLFLGSTCVMMTPNTFLKRPHLWLRMIDKFDVQHSCAPNFAFDLCRRRITEQQLAAIDLSGWRFVINGSEPIQASTIQAFAERFAAAGFSEQALCPCYGMAEATVFISGAAQRSPVIRQVNSELLEQHVFRLAESAVDSRHLVSCGPARDFDVRIVDPVTQQVQPAGAVGEIWLRGGSVAHGYWRNPEATSSTFQATTADGDSGYLRTGDLGVCFDDEIYVTGRMKEILIVHGRNLYPQDLEHEMRLRIVELSSRFGAVFTVNVAEQGEAVVFTHEIPGNVGPQRQQEIVAAIKLGVFQEFGVQLAGVLLLRPGGVLRTTSGKIRRALMRQAFLRGDLPVLYQSLDAGVQGGNEQSPLVPVQENPMGQTQEARI